MPRKCKDCGVENNGNNFSKSTQTRDGLATYCRCCLNKRTKISQAKNRTAAAVASIKQGARERGLEFSMSRDFVSKIKGLEALCDYCGSSVDNYKSLRDAILSYEKNDRIINQFKTMLTGSRQRVIEKMSIDRKDNSLGYTEENCVPCCYLCNRIKGSFMFYSHAKSILPEIMQDLRDRLERDKY